MNERKTRIRETVLEFKTTYADGGVDLLRTTPVQLALDARQQGKTPSETVGITDPAIAFDIDHLCSLYLPQSLYGKPLQVKVRGKVRAGSAFKPSKT
jgi:hypothetical protein